MTHTHSNPTGTIINYETDRRAVGLNTQFPHAPHALTLLASLASFHTRSPRCSLALRAARLACSARFARRLASAGLRSRFARACRLTCLLRSPWRLLASLDPPFLLLAPLVVSPAALPRCAQAASPVCSGSACRLACCALGSLVSSPAARSAQRLDCGSLRSPLAAPPAAHFARRLPARSARPFHSPCPPRLLHHFLRGRAAEKSAIP